MASPFDRIFAVAAATHDRLAGELFDIHPMKKQADINAPRVIDTDRAVVTGVRCPFVDAAARAAAGPFYQPGVKPERMGQATERASISLQLSLLPYAIRQGDRIIRQGNSAKYEAFEVLPSTPGFVHITLNNTAF